MMGGFLNRPFFKDQGNRDFLAAMGRSLMENAGSQGLGALGGAFTAGLAGRDELAERRRREEEEREAQEREDLRWEHYLERYEAAKNREKEERETRETETATEAERRRAALESLPPEQRSRVALFPGSKFWQVFEEVSQGDEEEAPRLVSDAEGNRWRWDPEDPAANEEGYVKVFPAPMRAPTIKDLGGGRKGQFNPETGKFDVIYAGDEDGGLSSSGVRSEARMEANRLYREMQGRVKRALEGMENKPQSPLELQRAIGPLIQSEDPGAEIARLFSGGMRRPTFDDIMGLLPSYEEVRQQVEQRLSGGSPGPGAAGEAAPGDEDIETQVWSLAGSDAEIQRVIAQERSKGRSWEEILRLMMEAAR